LQRKLKHTFNVQKRSSENLAAYEIMWKNMVQAENTTRRRKYAICMMDK